MEDAATKTAIVVYSRSGHSRRIARKLAEALDAIVIELNAPAYKGAFGYMHAGFNSLKQSCALAPQKFDSLAKFGRLILCGPVWTSYPAIPLRGLLRSDIALPQSVSLFLTSGDSAPAVKAFKTAEADLGRPLTAKASLGNRDERTLKEDRKMGSFLKELEAANDDRHADPSFARLHAL
ncbi:MAG: hypothetical protein HKN18_17735 [Silicimonas sp.]|nr:hypothetical protein [Silicimonas sp.]